MALKILNTKDLEKNIIPINKLLLISKLTATNRVMAVLTTEDPTPAFRNQPKCQDFLDFAEKIHPKPKNFNAFILLSVLTFHLCRLSGELLSCGDVNTSKPSEMFFKHTHQLVDRY